MEKPSDPSTTPVNTPTIVTTKKKKKTTTTEKKKKNFKNDFLTDFRLIQSSKVKLEDGRYQNAYDWIYSKQALERFHTSTVFSSPNGTEGPKHSRLKGLVYAYIYENYYLENECKFLVTTELEQKSNPFYSYIDGKIPVFFTMDICVIRDTDNQVFDIEIDGPEHYTKGGMMKAEIRDEWLKDRYGVLTYRIDMADDEPNYKRIDEFISQPAVQNPNKSKKTF